MFWFILIWAPILWALELSIFVAIGVPIVFGIVGLAKLFEHRRIVRGLKEGYSVYHMLGTRRVSPRMLRIATRINQRRNS